MLSADHDDTRPSSLDQLIGRLFETIRHGVDANAFDVLVQADLTFTQVRTLAVLGETDEPRPISDIAEALAVSLPTAGRAVDHLVREGLVKRWEDPEDRRSRLVELTASGRGLVEVHRATIAEHIRSFSENLPGHIAQDLAEAIDAALAAHPDPPGLVCRLTPGDLTATGPRPRTDSDRTASDRTASDTAPSVDEPTTRITR